MFELTNEQRKCFGLSTVDSGWLRIEPKPSRYHHHTTIAYLDGTVLKKYIETGDNTYTEYEICEQLSVDHRYLLPKTSRGKPVLFTAATLEKRTGFGMCLSYSRHEDHSRISLYSHTSQKCYYASDYDPVCIEGNDGFQRWVENWCSETTEEDLAAVARFAAEPKRHVKFREGDVFRFKINRRLYGYGRILLDYDLMRKKKEAFWGLMGKPLVCSVYHIATERDDVSIDELMPLKSLPSVHIMDNALFYGEFEIIGNIPVGETEDYPIRYGNSNNVRIQAVLLQCGKLYRRIDNQKALYSDFTNQVIGFTLRFKLPVLLECITHNSNDPYWAQEHWKISGDLRNPKFRKELEQICKQFDLAPSQLIK